MSIRDSRRRRPVLEPMEMRLALSSMGGPGPSPGGHHDVVDNDPNDDGDRPGDGHHWEPKPIGHGSTRPNVPSGPVRW